MQKWDRWGRMQVWGMRRWMFGACVATTGILGTHHPRGPVQLGGGSVGVQLVTPGPVGTPVH